MLKKLFLYLLPRHKNNCILACHFYVVTITTPLLRPKSLNKMIDLFKNGFPYIIQEMYTTFLRKNIHACCETSPTILRRKRCVIFIRGHKGQNSTGTPCRDFLALESRCRGFLVLESRCRGFLSSEKTPWNHDVVAYLSPFLDVVVFWSWNLDVVAFWSWNLDVGVF